MGRLPQGRLDDLAAVLRPGEVSATAGQGYFKLKRAERRDPTDGGIPAGQPRLLVVRTAIKRRTAACPQNLLTPEGRGILGSCSLRKPEQSQLKNGGLSNRSPSAVRLGCPTGAACCSGRPTAWRTMTSGSLTRCLPSTQPAAGTKVHGSLPGVHPFCTPAALPGQCHSCTSLLCILVCVTSVCRCYAQLHTQNCAGGDDKGFKYYRDRIAEVSGRYEKVLMLGDSMGEPHPCPTDTCY
jgi:hypothetical protein